MTGYIICETSCSKLIKNFYMATTESRTKCRALLRTGLYETSQAVHSGKSPPNNQTLPSKNVNLDHNDIGSGKTCN